MKNKMDTLVQGAYNLVKKDESGSSDEQNA